MFTLLTKLSIEEAVVKEAEASEDELEAKLLALLSLSRGDGDIGEGEGDGEAEDPFERRTLCMARDLACRSLAHLRWAAATLEPTSSAALSSPAAAASERSCRTYVRKRAKQA